MCHTAARETLDVNRDLYEVAITAIRRYNIAAIKLVRYFVGSVVLYFENIYVALYFENYCRVE